MELNKLTLTWGRHFSAMIAFLLLLPRRVSNIPFLSKLIKGNILHVHNFFSIFARMEILCILDFILISQWLILNNNRTKPSLENITSTTLLVWWHDQLMRIFQTCSIRRTFLLPLLLLEVLDRALIPIIKRTLRTK